MASAIVKSVEIHESQEDCDWVEADIELTLGELIEMDIESLNDFVEENILADYRANMSYTRYSVVDCRPSDNVVLVKVTADIEYWG